MKLAYRGDEFQQSGFAATGKAEGLNGKHLRKVNMLLTSGLYKNPKDAVLRELVSNGFDSKRDAKVQVWLPTALNPVLIVRDDGPGMSDEFMLNRYTTITDSTKDDDDDAIGGFGIGRLTAFADDKSQFTVTVFRGDHKQIYNVAMIDYEITISGTDQIALDDEEWGVEVRIPVPLKEHSLYREAATRALRFFTPERLTVVGATIEAPQYTFECDDYAVLKTTGYGHNQATYAVQGPVAYQFDYEQLGIPANIEFRFKLGEVTVTPDREGLKLDPRTIAAIKAKHKKLMDDIQAQVTQAVAAASTRYEAMQLFYDNWMAMRAMQQFLPRDVMWRGEKIESIKVPALYHYQKDDLKKKNPMKRENGFERKPNNYDREGFSAHFMIDDVDNKRVMARCKEHADTIGGFTHLFIVYPQTIADLGVPADRIFKASDYTPPATLRSKGSVTSGKLTAYKWFRDPYDWRSTHKWRQADVEVSDGGYYFEFKASAPPQWADEIRGLPWFNSTTIYGLPGEFRRRAVLDDWTEATAATRERAQALIDDPEFQRDLVWDVAYAQLDGTVLWMAENAVLQDPLIDDLLLAMATHRPSKTFDSDDKRSIRSLVSCGFIANPNEVPVPDLAAVQEALFTQRPVFRELITRGCSDADILKLSLEIKKP